MIRRKPNYPFKIDKYLSLFNFKWSTLYKIGQSKAIRSSYFWFIILPVIAKLLSNNTVIEHLKANHLDFIVNIRLPFSWMALFFAATFISIGELIYLVFCPTIIKSFSDFEAYNNAGKTYCQLIQTYTNMVTPILETDAKNGIVNNLNMFYSDYCNQNEEIDDLFKDDPVSVGKILSNLCISNDKLRGAFWHVRDVAETLKKRLRFSCSSFIILGLILIGLVFLQNVAYVISVSDFYTEHLQGMIVGRVIDWFLPAYN